MSGSEMMRPIPNVHSLKDLRNVEVEIDHRHVEAGVTIMSQ